MAELNDDQRERMEAAVFRRLVAHLQKRTDVQNIDMMNLAGFCRNCLSNWYVDAAKDLGADLDKDAARALVYGMRYDEWKAQHQTEATEKQLADYEAAKPKDHQ